MVPMGMIQKMFGKSVLAEEFNKLVSESLFNYIRENKLNVLGEPMPVADQPEINFDGQEDFTVSFDVALAPEISVNLSKEDCVDYYNVTVDDTMVEKQCEALANRFGTQKLYGKLLGKRIKTMERIKEYMRGWLNYYSMADMKNNVERLNRWYDSREIYRVG